MKAWELINLLRFDLSECEVVIKTSKTKNKPVTGAHKEIHGEKSVVILETPYP